MYRLESLALELLEYKAEEYGAKRVVRGGNQTLWNLVALLTRERDRLTTEERQRLDRATDSLQTFSGGDGPSITPSASLGELVIGAGDDDVILDTLEEPPRPPDTPAEREEHAVLQRLARRVWWDDLEAFVHQIATSWRSQRDRYGARLIFGTLQNLERNASNPKFNTDVNLKSFKVVVPIPPLTDPLVSLSDVDSLAEIARDLINLIMTLGRDGSPYPDLELPEAGALAYVRQAAMVVAGDPYAGKTAAMDSKLPSSKQLRMAITELTKERLPEEERATQRRELERRLAEALSMERNERQAFQRDASMLQDVVHVTFERLADYLPTNVGGRAGGAQLEGGVLFGVNPALRAENIGPATSDVTVRLVGPVRLTLQGHDFAFSGVDAARTLFVDGKTVDLGGSTVVQLGHERLGVFREGDYVHLRVRNEGRSLAVRLAEALTVLHVLTSPHREELLTIAKVIANSVRGEPQELVVQALSRANQLSLRAPDRRQALDGLWRGAARATNVDIGSDVIAALVDKMLDALSLDPTDMSGALQRAAADESAFHTLTGDPLTVDLAGHKITVRQYRGRSRHSQESLVAMLPGQVLGSFTDYLLAPLGGGTLVFVRGGSDLAVLHLADAKLLNTVA